jgi:hypothetical protein
MGQWNLAEAKTLYLRRYREVDIVNPPPASTPGLSGSHSLSTPAVCTSKAQPFGILEY